jgi:sugar/nucleoside kinase (ribokinase family)
MKKYDVGGLGFCSFDYLCIVPHIPLDEKVEVIKSLTQGGGPSATATVAAARLGASATFIGAIGDDDRGEAILKGFNKEGVNTDHIQKKTGRESPVAFCWIEKESGKRSIAWSKGNSMPLDPSWIDPELIASLKLLHLDGHNIDAAVKAALIAKKNGVIVSLDAGTIVPGIEKLVELSDICIASKPFSLKFTGEEDPMKAAHKLNDGNKLISAVTWGKNGVFSVVGKKGIIKKAFSVNVVDTTGAGDVFHGAFAYAVIHGWSMENALDFASATAALKCTMFGGRTGIPAIPVVIEFLNTKGISL